MKKGNVLATIIGGIIGFQNTDDLSSSFVMEKVVGLTDWNNTGEDDGVDYRKEITARLFRNSVGFYKYNNSNCNYCIKFIWIYSQQWFSSR